MSSEHLLHRTDRTPKKFRSCEPDLKVVLGNDTLTIRWHYANVLASQSGFVDTMLAINMKERSTMEIFFPEMDGDTWDAMLKFVEDPTAELTIQEAMQLVQYYDIYQFTTGLLVCGKVFKRWFQELNDENEAPDVDTIVSVIVLARDVQLEPARQTGMKYVYSKLMSTSVPYGRTMFTQCQVERLVPLLLEDCKPPGDGPHEKDDWWMSHPMAWVQSPEFPQSFVRECSEWLIHNQLLDTISHIVVTGTGCKADGDYKGDGTGIAYEPLFNRMDVWGGVQVAFLVTKTKNWVIARETYLPQLDQGGEPDLDSIVETACWECPCSENLALPPENNWKPVDPLAQGSPTIKIVYK